MLILLRPILLTLVPFFPSLAPAQEHPLAPFAEQLQSDVLFLTELEDLQERLIKTAEQDPSAVRAEGRRGSALCDNSPVETLCALLPYTVGEDDD